MNITNLTDEQKRVLIAEACGKLKCWPHNWEEQSWPGCGYVKDNPPNQEVRVCKKCNKVLGRLVLDNTISNLPDYLNDLNAIHEAEKVLTDEQWTRYLNRLTESDPDDCTWPTCYLNLEAVRFCTSATARQRADAFLLTLPEPEQSQRK